jgi:hypothetical protein
MNIPKKNTNYILYERKKEKKFQISWKITTTPPFISPQREKKSTLLGLICFWRESQRKTGKLKKKREILRFTGISSLLLHHLIQRQNKWVSKFHHFEVKKIEKTFFIFIPHVNIPLRWFLLRPLFLNCCSSLSFTCYGGNSLSQTYFIKLKDNHIL